MDYFAHALWTRAVYHKTPHPWYGAFWGVFPDTISWVPFFFYRLFTGGAGMPSEVLPAWMDFLYGISHSVVVFAVVCGIIFLFKRHLPIYLWGWLLHIFIDVPTHAATRWPTPFLWPLVDVKFPGVSWGTPWFMYANYAALIGVYIYLYLLNKKKVSV
jgi:hypothetical protein